MICFHFTIFVVLETTKGTPISHQNQLWFAFILLSLSYWKQHPCLTGHTHHGCDLLSFYYLCRTGNNMKNRWLLASELWFAFILLPLPYWKQPYICPFPFRQVVICFHFTTFAVLETASRYFNLGCIELWFAFILLPLPYWKQRTCWRGSGSTSCDLLSFYYLCRTGNSRLWTASPRWRVVICFHFTTFAVLETA